MKKFITVAILLICVLSFVVSPVMAAQDDKIVTPAQKAKDKLQEHKETKIVKQKASHDKSLYTNEVPGVGNLKYEGEKVPPGFEKKEETVTMVSWQHNGKLHIRDTEHKTTTIQVPWSTLEQIEGFDGEHVRVWHYDDSGTCDGKWIQTVSNEGGYAYLEEVPFSEVIVSGYTGTYSKVESEIDVTDTVSLGRAFDSDEVSSVTLTIDDQYSSKTDPYDIPTDGLVAWYRFDDAGSTVIDYSGNGNNGTFTAATYTAGKYNNAGVFDGVDDTVSIPTFASDAYSICTWASGKNGYFILDGNDQNTMGIRGGLTTGGNQLYLRINGAGSGMSWYGPYIDGTQTNFIVYNIWNEGGHANLEAYVNSELVATKTDFTFEFDAPNSNGYLGTQWSTSTACLNGTLDEFLIYNETNTQEVINELYYVGVSSLQAKTNSNATYSDYWNSSADNPLSVPYGASESISSISFAQPESIVQNGITIYNPVNVLMNVTATIGYTEDTYLIEEFCDEGFYIDQYAVEISHTPSADNANGLISYNPTDSLCSDIMSKSWDYDLQTNNPNASITTFNMNSLVIDTGAITAGTEYSYVLTAETSDEVAHTELESDISSAIQMSGILPMLLIAASILGLLIGLVTGNVEFDTAVKSVGVVIFLSVVLYVGIAILNTIATALG